MISNIHQSRWSIPSGVSSSYSANGWKYGNASSYVSFYLETLISNPSSIEFTLNDFDVHYSDVPNFRLVDSNKSNPIPLFNIPFNTSSTIYFCDQSTSHTALKGAIYRIEVNSNSASLYENDVLIKTVSQTFHQSMKLRTTTGTQRYVQIKDLKIKRL